MSDKNKIPESWSVQRYFYAIAWWRENGHFNTELYKRIVEIKHNINLK